MKHTNFHSQLKEIRCNIIKELQAALNAHSGSYTWGEENEDGDVELPDTDNCPLILANPTHSDGPSDVYIAQISYGDNGFYIVAYTKEWLDEIDIEIDDIEIGHLEFIIDYIPETQEVSDVSINK